MAIEYKKAQPRRYPKTPSTSTPEARYWKKYKNPVLIKESAAVSHIDFSPISPHNFAITSSMHVQVYSAQTLRVTKTISRFKGAAFSGNFRSDGKLLVAGDDTGLIQVFDANSRSILRSMRANQHPVHVTNFAGDKTHVLSCSDDKIVRLWDMPTQEATAVMEGHEDYVRTGLVSEANPHLILSGSYDQTIKLWDTRSSACTLTMQHSAPVNSVLMFPSGGMVVSAGGPYLKVWDLMAGGRCIHTLSNHQKSITCLTFDGSRKRLLSGSLDQHVKVYDVSSYRVVHNIKYSAAVMTVAISPDDKHILAGTQSGYLAIRKRQFSKEEIDINRNEQSRLRSYQSFLVPSPVVEEGTIVRRTRGQKLQEYDRFLKSFQYGNALDAALRKNLPPSTIIGLILELTRRGGLRAALSGRDDLTLEPVLKFLLKNVTNPRHSSILCDVANLVIDIYGSVCGQSPVISSLIQSLAQKVRQEVTFHSELLAVQGQLEMVLANAALSNLRQPNQPTTPGPSAPSTPTSNAVIV